MNIYLVFAAIERRSSTNGFSRFRWMILKSHSDANQPNPIENVTQEILTLANLSRVKPLMMSRWDDLNFPQWVINRLNKLNDGNVYHMQIQEWF